MRTLAQALIARTTGKAFPDQSTLPRDASFHNVVRRDAAANRYLAAREHQRLGQRARTGTLAGLLAAAAAIIPTGLALAPNPIGLMLCILGIAAIIITLIPPAKPNDTF